MENDSRADCRRFVLHLPGVVLGGAVAILFDSLLLLATTGWFAVGVVPIVVPFLVCVFAGGTIAHMVWPQQLKVRLSRRTLVGIAVIVWPLCVLGPIGTRYFQLFREAEKLAVCGGCTRGKIRVVPIGYDDPPGYYFTLQCEHADAYAQSYHERLIEEGWEVRPTPPSLDSNVHMFARLGRRLAVTEVPTTASGPTAEIRVRGVATNLVYR